jgi:hypothetical protein
MKIFLNWNANFWIENINLKFKYQFLDQISLYLLKISYINQIMFLTIEITIFRFIYQVSNPNLKKEIKILVFHNWNMNFQAWLKNSKFKY